MMFNFFKNNGSGLIDLNKLYWPEVSIKWHEPWWHLIDEEELRKGLQEELHNEIGPKHPLWNLNPLIFAKNNNNDDVLVQLNNDKFAVVHLLWHGHIDQCPDTFPRTYILNTEADLQAYIDERENN